MAYEKRKYVTVKATLRQVVQVGEPDADGMITIDYLGEKVTARVHQDEVTRLRKYVRGVLLDCYYCGKHTDKEGRVWMCYSPNGISLSAWVRLECDGYRPRMVYDAGSGFRRNLARD